MVAATQIRSGKVKKGEEVIAETTGARGDGEALCSQVTLVILFRCLSVRASCHIEA
jgi:hypothetical protein